MTSARHAADIAANDAATDAAALLQIRGLDVWYPGGAAVRDFSLTIHRNEVVALVGESGCGKSTIAAAITGLLSPKARASGEILLDGRNLRGATESQLQTVRGNHIAMIFQDPMTSLNPVLTIGLQIIEVLHRHRGLRGAAARARAIELLELVKIPEPERRIDDYPHKLSGGQRQRVMIAMAIACEPRLLIADEPTTALDATIQAQVLELLDELRQKLSMSLLLITHDLGVVGQWADRVAVMRHGVKVEEGTCAEVFFAASHPYTQTLLDATLHLTRNRAPLRQVSAPATPVLEVRKLVAQYSTRYGTISAVKGVSFEIARGETLGLVGESGCGKSTLSKTIIGLNPVVEGEVVLDGVDIASLRGSKLRPHRAKVQLVFQDPYASLNPRLRIDDMLDEVQKVQGQRDRHERQRRIRAMLDAVGLPADAARRHPHEFSGGQRQRIGIARALILQPQLLICDEPVSALDVSVRAQILKLFVDLKQEFGLSYLFISHDLSVINYMADRVMVMQKGEVVETIDRDRLFSGASHPYTRQLIAAHPAWPQPDAGPAVHPAGRPVLARRA
ncbi:ABC transporter ATP-binding protein [Duganella sp. BuS-21]|uniref:ABC transporter ATP-binding protein n=1 Tax=Duganella sp. BuS-21 TaxID=2943848 RepID=UPI0035A69ED3